MYFNYKNEIREFFKEFFKANQQPAAWIEVN